MKKLSFILSALAFLVGIVLSAYCIVNRNDLYFLLWIFVGFALQVIAKSILGQENTD